ncbi:ribose 5-phosphate isomerase A [Salinicoccus hispanicus]|uniref:Ribose 5-phosphate isomerase A n=1 Tax=Salinicoccus hispanicus TaxID=157225 RepID=A0A6N8U4I5_9STAP|nr:ribose 5-phosphate isomerase A [Salinicoccus hispanicus]MXQ51385.1 ribose 5-phosphate isomerase A [Salinicoccus hispanicus]
MTNIKNDLYNTLNTLVSHHTVIGIGSGSTIEGYIPYLAKYISENELAVKLVPTSMKTERKLKEAGLKSTDEIDRIDVTIDGANQFTDDFIAIKGGGGSLLREKIVGYFSESIVIVASDNKHIEELHHITLPVEINAYMHRVITDMIEQTLGISTVLRKKEGEIFITDNGNYVLDCFLPDISDPSLFERKLMAIPGVLETGLFTKHINQIISFNDDEIKTLYKERL